MKSGDHRSKRLARATMRPIQPVARRRWGAALLAVICLSPAGVAAQFPTSTWVGTTSDFNTASNWNPPGVPLFPQSAAFSGAGVTSVTNALGLMPGIQFSGAQSYVIDVSALGLTLNLTGIANNSSVPQTIRSLVGGNLFISGGAVANTNILMSGAGSDLLFATSATALNANIVMSNSSNLNMLAQSTLGVATVTHERRRPEFFRRFERRPGKRYPEQRRRSSLPTTSCPVPQSGPSQGPVP